MIAADVLGIEPCSIMTQSDPGGSAPGLVAPVDAGGQTLINWTRTPGVRTWSDVFRHIPVARILEIALNRQAIEENRIRPRLEWGKLVALRHKETIASYNDYARLVNERLYLERQAETTEVLRSDHDQRIAKLDEAIASIESQAAVWLRRMHSEWGKTTPVNDEERAQRVQIYRMYSELIDGALERRLDAANARLDERNQGLISELQPQIADRICLVGYTASAQADMVSTPVFDRMPGVMAHANVINMVLTGAYVQRLAWWANGLVMVLAGLCASWFASRRGAVTSLLMAAGTGALLLLGGTTCFRFLDTYVATIPALLAIVIPWGGVTVFRQLTEERARRDFERALSLYVSPAVAARIAERSDRSDLAPQPAQVTCFFSDLQGFTRLSERLGPERTRDVLNPYFESLARALHTHGGLVNKFIGDGVFGFFNAPILPCANHAAAACASALEAVRRISATGVSTGHNTKRERLVVRIGLASGAAFVGDYGSDAKLDYTCIGDTVNVASRLEGLNKALGTTILVNDACREQAGDEFAYRPVGLVQLAGRTEPASVFELRGLVSLMTTDEARFDRAFARLVLAYQAGDISPCRAAMAECRDINPEDRVLDLYERGLSLLDSPDRPEDWRGTVDVSGGY